MFSKDVSYKQKQPPEVFCKNGVLKNYKYSQENTCARNSFVIKLQASGDCFCTKEILDIPDLVLILIPIEKAAALLASGLAGCLIK